MFFFVFCFSCQFADSVLGWSLLSLLLTSSWMFLAHSFLDFCCCLCIASYFCRCLQFYIQLEITHSPGFTPLSFLLFQYPLPFLFTIAIYTIKDYWFPLAIPFPLHTGISISTQSKRLTCRHKELALRLLK